MMYGLDLFSGIGGNSLALAEWVNTVAYCEQDRYAQAVLLSRMSEGLLPSRPIWDDVRTLCGDMLPKIDIIVGGFPCQDISVAGRGAGLAGERSGLFFEIVRLAEEIKPKFLFLENVPAIRTRGAARVIEELSRVGYDCRWTIVSAAEVGAHHKRERWFLLAHLRDSFSNNEISKRAVSEGPSSQLRGMHATKSLAHGSRIGRSQSRTGTEVQLGQRSDTAGSSEPSLIRPNWEPEPDVGRVVNGLPYRVDRIKCLGNAVVPAQAREAFLRLIGVINE